MGIWVAPQRMVVAAKMGSMVKMRKILTSQSQNRALISSLPRGGAAAWAALAETGGAAVMAEMVGMAVRAQAVMIVKSGQETVETGGAAVVAGSAEMAETVGTAEMVGTAAG